MKGSFGPTLDPKALEDMLSWLLDQNDSLARRGRRSTPVCIWGTHGVGKTTLVEDVARERGYQFVYCAPAQFEEMGDLHGLPTLVNGRTHYAAPSWVPTTDGPGVLLLDDLNRADDRILRGLMPLLQTQAMMSWRLPTRWQIVATANPEGGDYSVTPMDPAIIDRMVHLGMAFDAKAWARWATRMGVDPRGINFLLLYPEIVTGERTTPRALVRFFELIGDIADLGADIDRVWSVGRAVLEEPTIAAFVAFVSDNLPVLIEPAELLDLPTTKELDARVESIARDGDSIRVDRLATVATRVFLHMTTKGYAPGERHAKNIVAFLMHETLPNDLRLSLHRDLVAQGGAAVAAMLRDPTLSKKLLTGM
jgi:AAA domain (dynein-related subfamily)